MQLQHILKKPYARFLSSIFFGNHYMPFSYQAYGKIKTITEEVLDKKLANKRGRDHKTWELQFDTNQFLIFGRKQMFRPFEFISTIENEYVEKYREQTRIGSIESTLYKRIGANNSDSKMRNYEYNTFYKSGLEFHFSWKGKQREEWLRQTIIQIFTGEQKMCIELYSHRRETIEIYFSDEFNRIEKIIWLHPRENFVYASEHFHYNEQGIIHSSTVEKRDGKTMSFQQFKRYDKYYNLILQTSIYPHFSMEDVTRDNTTEYAYEYDEYGNWLRCFDKDPVTDALTLFVERSIEYHNYFWDYIK